MTAVTFLMGVISGGIAGYMMRDFKIYLDDERRMRKIIKTTRERIERERMT